MAKILIIDDDGIVRDALSLLLMRSGHKVYTSADEAGGAQIFNSIMPDMVVINRDLPVASNSEVFGLIREISMKKPVLLIGSNDVLGNAGAHVNKGPLFFLPKGAGLSHVLAEIDRILGVRHNEVAAPPKAGKAVTPAVRTAPSLSAGVILIADDDDQTIKVLRRFLSSLGYKVHEARNGAEALEIARTHRFDIILLDIAMPGKTGIEVLMELAPEMPETGFMMITGNDDESMARECLESGAFDYIPKPINMESLARSIKARLLLQR